MTTTCPDAPPGTGPATAGAAATGPAAATPSSDVPVTPNSTAPSGTAPALGDPGAVAQPTAGPAAPATRPAGAAAGSDALMRALDALVDRVPGARLAVLLSPDGLRLGASRGTEEAVAEQVSGMVAGLWALGAATARFCADAEPRRIVTRMPGALLHVTGIRTGVVLALHTGEQSRAADIEFEVARFVTEADRRLPAQPTPPPDAPGPGAAHPTPGVPPGSGAALPLPVPSGAALPLPVPSGPVARAGTGAPGRIRPALLAAAAAPPAPGAAGGATESEQPDLASLVLARPGTGRLPRLTPEQARIVRRCRRPLSVAEIATDLDLPVGAVRVLLDGLRRAGLVEVRDLPSHDGRPSLERLERLLSALRAW
ncbi:DUF742 domain-containing protein [Micromonospora haikouensis]|uniref:DUF742 domain-containing protein n=1 Tax=Micromonospora haikouensis TaxID=686309 RepID=UPI003D72A772